MEDWIDITTASWDGLLSAGELVAISEESRTRELTKMAGEIRTMIRSHSPNTVSANPLKIPEGFLGRALLIVRNRLLTGIPDYVIDDDRRKQAEQAEAWFLRVADGKIRPEPASDAVANQTPAERPASVEVVSSRESRTGADNMQGL